MTTATGYAAPATTCPEGTKLWILELGNLIVDEAWLMRGANTSTVSEPNPTPKRRKCVVLAVLIEMPGVDGLILFETGCSPNMDRDWGDALQDVFAPEPRPYGEEFSLPHQIKKTGHSIDEVKHILIGHLHLDHAGGLDYFKGRSDVTVYTHEIEFKHSFWAIATRMDNHVYLSHYLDLNLRWETYETKDVELFPGLSLFHSPGHTPGLSCMMLHLKNAGTFIFTTDQYHIRENYYGHPDGSLAPHGHLARSHDDWYHSHCNIKRLVQRYQATIVFGHDFDTFKALKANPEHYD